MSDAFHKQEIVETTEELTRDEDALQLGVHVMSEFIFCPRAGIIASESRQDDSGSEFVAAPALGGVPSFERDKIEKALEQYADSLKKIGLLFLAAFSVAVITWAVLPSLGMILAVAMVAGALVSAKLSWWPELQRYLYCKQRLREARRAAKREPNWDLNAQQKVHWWELIQSGFDSRELKESLYNPDINLKGKPWRILRRGDKHLPVLRIRVKDYHPGNVSQVRLREQQRARIAAYAYLIETCERGQADWAIVLFNNCDEGVAVPIGQAEWRAFRRGLEKARTEFLELRENMRYEPPPADNGNACKNCPFGKPRVVGREPTVLRGRELPAYATDDRKEERRYHCTCGDRFRNVPPHEDAVNLGLTD